MLSRQVLNICLILLTTGLTVGNGISKEIKENNTANNSNELNITNVNNNSKSKYIMNDKNTQIQNKNSVISNNNRNTITNRLNSNNKSVQVKNNQNNGFVNSNAMKNKNIGINQLNVNKKNNQIKNNTVIMQNKNFIQKLNNKNKNINSTNKNGSLLSTIKQNARDEIIKDTQKRSKIQNYIKSYLPTNLPPQLIRCMENALKNNEEIKEAQKEVLAIHEDHNIQRSNLMPKIQATSGFKTADNDYSKPFNEDSRKTSGFSHNNTNVCSTGIGLSYNLFHGGSDVASLRSTDKSIEAKWKHYEATIQKVLQNVAKKYFEIVIQQEKIKNIKSLLKLRKENQRVAEEMLAAGTAKQLDKEQAYIGLEETESKLVSAEAEERSERAVLKQLTGVDVTEELNAPDKLFDKKFTKSESLNVASKNNPNVMEASAAHIAEKEKLFAYSGNFFPKIDLEANYSMQYTHTKKYDQYDHVNPLSDSKALHHVPTISITASLPIFSGGQLFSSKVKQAYIVAKSAIAKDKIYKEIESGISQILESLDASENSITSARKIIAAQEIVLKTINDEHAAGTKLMADVLDAQQKLFEAQSMLTNAINNRYIQQCNLMALLGWFNPRDLKLKGLQFDYMKEYNRQIHRRIPTFEEMGVETRKPLVTNNKPKALQNSKKR